MTFVIGIAGRKRAGKSTVAQMLLDIAAEIDTSAEIHAFADPLREMLLDLDPYVMGEWPSYTLRLSEVLKRKGGWEGVKDSIYATEVRRLMQRFGTEVIRERDPEFWTRQMETLLEKTTANFVLVPDVRFENEAAICDTVIHVARPPVEVDDPHPSEKPVQPFAGDIFVDNNGTLEQLREFVEDVVAPEVFR